MAKPKAAKAERAESHRDSSGGDQKLLDAKRELRQQQLRMILREEALRKAEKK